MSKIEMGKKYKTRSGLAVRVICIDRNDPHFPVIALLTQCDHEEVFKCTAGGKYYHSGNDSSRDLFEVGPYDHLKVDDLVVVRDSNANQWTLRYFAGVDQDGRPTAWVNGATSTTAERAVPWKYCELFDATNLSHIDATRSNHGT